MLQEERYRKILQWFVRNMPVAVSELHFDNPFQLLVAVMLSAQCTDKRVNTLTPELFARYPDPRALSRADVAEIYEIIKSVTYPNSKARHLKAMAQELADRFASEVPDSVEALQTLPGVGRKTANVVASVAYHKPVIAVDTHVFRISRRLGLSTGTTPLAVEKELSAHIPESQRAIAHHWLILHGRYVCTARNPRCPACGLQPYCKDYEDRQG